MYRLGNTFKITSESLLREATVQKFVFEKLTRNSKDH